MHLVLRGWRWEDQDQCWLHGEFEAILKYVKPWREKQRERVGRKTPVAIGSLVATPLSIYLHPIPAQGRASCMGID